ncbi:Peroxidase [Rhynchospora pubera]|uniref:Peroxidase n=1 Tax=Rhynchospora pubera TaxID=906938 RepID=A0AAV8E438_9POAL|nr:Peroxidase [Rhynchospora pubera]
MEARRGTLIVIVALIAFSSVSTGEALSSDYYQSTCPNLRQIVCDAVKKKINETAVTIPAVIRLFFHDAMITGSDASTLISLPTEDAEKDSSDNKSLAGDGFDTVIRAKKEVEKACPGVVSCADILALATSCAIELSGGPSYTVELGRYDGLVSNASLVDGNLPGPNFDLDKLIAIFDKHGFTLVDLVALSGAHTVGFCHCSRFADRLYNYNGQLGATDPTFNPQFADQLKQACPSNVGPTIAVNLDPFTPITFDNLYFSNLVNGYGLLTSDEVLYTDTRSRPIVQWFAANQTAFFEAFVVAIGKVGSLDVKTSADGEIRKDCTAYNKKQ